MLFTLQSQNTNYSITNLKKNLLRCSCVLLKHEAHDLSHQVITVYYLGFQSFEVKRIHLMMLFIETYHAH